MYIYKVGFSEKEALISNWGPSMQNADFPGYLWDPILLLHTTKFSKEELTVMCEASIKKSMPLIVDLAFKEFGEDILNDNVGDYWLCRSLIAATVYQGLVEDYGFVKASLTEEFFIPANVKLELNPDVHVRRSKSLAYRIKLWFQEIVRERRGKNDS